ncbi:hypothetical protein CR513_12804, partial [Mucuna pruriens]
MCLFSSLKIWLIVAIFNLTITTNIIPSSLSHAQKTYANKIENKIKGIPYGFWTLVSPTMLHMNLQSFSKKTYGPNHLFVVDGKLVSILNCNDLLLHHNISTMYIKIQF